MINKSSSKYETGGGTPGNRTGTSYDGSILKPSFYIDVVNFVLHNRKRPNQDANLPRILLENGTIQDNKSIYEVFDGNPLNFVRIVPDNANSDIRIALELETSLSILDIDYIAFLGHNLNNTTNEGYTKHHNDSVQTYPGEGSISLSSYNNYPELSWGEGHFQLKDLGYDDNDTLISSNILNAISNASDGANFEKIQFPKYQGSSIYSVKLSEYGFYSNSILITFHAPENGWEAFIQENGIQLGAIFMGSKIDFSNSPDIMTIKQNNLYDGVKKSRGIGGYDNTSINYTLPFYDINGNKVPPFETLALSSYGTYMGAEDYAYSTNGSLYNHSMTEYMISPYQARREWQFEFSHLTSEEIYPSQTSLVRTDIESDVGDIETDNIMKFMDRTIGGSLPFIFQQNKTAIGQNSGFHPRSFCIANLKENSLQVDQVGPSVFKYAFNIEESW